jgi:hypothetical protein
MVRLGGNLERLEAEAASHAFHSVTCENFQRGHDVWRRERLIKAELLARRVYQLTTLPMRSENPSDVGFGIEGGDLQCIVGHRHRG